MPYTHVWSVTEPPGTALARDIDQKIRDVRLDLEERLEEVIIEDMSADPVVLKDLPGIVKPQLYEYDTTLAAGSRVADPVANAGRVVHVNLIGETTGLGSGKAEMIIDPTEFDPALDLAKLYTLTFTPSPTAATSPLIGVSWQIVTGDVIQLIFVRRDGGDLPIGSNLAIQVSVMMVFSV